MKLESIAFLNAPKLPALRTGHAHHLECDNPPEALRGWKVEVRGAAVLLISPPGWSHADKCASVYTDDYEQKYGKSTKPRTICEVPRAQVYLHWLGDVDPKALGNYASQPMGIRERPADESPKSLLAQIDPKDLGDE